MSSWRQQALIEAPVESVWGLLEDPSSFPRWSDSIEVTGIPTRIEKGSEFNIKGPGPLGMRATTTFRVEELDELHEIKLRCQRSGFYSRWTLTEAQGNTFADVEMGVEPVPGVAGRAMSAIHTKRYLRKATEESLDGLRREVRRDGPRDEPE
jgi:uncharacterized protein YndB with AHSA1/START domain